ncbi:PQQ-binding-like beta-propeller repeat protein [Dactylosporangium sp. NPDC048998]|uniref:outer membrane protein assembly factor BamB family protein n=1 Tax=Dactylosporangium sp. NPDC048998 TaxID=3363976 RepID=UPI00371948B4
MPDAMIELDITTPWEPPPGQPPPRRRRRPLRLAVVLALVVGLLSGAGARRDLAPLYGPGLQVITVLAGGGQLYLVRPQLSRDGTVVEAGTVIEAVDAAGGGLLWRRSLDRAEPVVATDRIVLLQEEHAGEGTRRIFALDAATGAVRWERAEGWVVGLADPPGRLVLLNDRVWRSLAEGLDTSYGDPEDPAVALPMVPNDERYVAVEPDTGRVVWSVEMPPGTVPSLSMTTYPVLTGLTDLDAGGVLRVHDVRTGALAATYRLDWSGPVARHEDGVSGQQVVYRAGGRGADVYDRVSGRLLWHWAGDAAHNGPYPCLDGRYCVLTGEGTDVLDAATGARLWQADGYGSGVLYPAGGLVLVAHPQARDAPNGLVAFAGDTGAVRWRLKGWLPIFGSTGSGPFVWRTTNLGDAVIGRLDPADGTVRVIGRTHDFNRDARCAATDSRLACVAAGALFVWALP